MTPEPDLFTRPEQVLSGEKPHAPLHGNLLGAPGQVQQPQPLAFLASSSLYVTWLTCLHWGTGSPGELCLLSRLTLTMESELGG